MKLILFLEAVRLAARIADETAIEGKQDLVSRPEGYAFDSFTVRFWREGKDRLTLHFNLAQNLKPKIEVGSRAEYYSPAELAGFIALLTEVQALAAKIEAALAEYTIVVEMPAEQVS